MEKNTDIHQYRDVIKRRKFHFILPGVLVFFLAATLALILPPVYKSTATILVEAQEISEDFVRSTVPEYVQARLEAISRIVLSRENLLDMINRVNLYQDSEEQKTREEFIEEVRDAIKIEPVTAEVQDRRLERTVAFTVSYEGKEPEKVMQVTNYLASLFMEINVRNRENKARTTVEFLENQAAELRSDIFEIESQVAVYKKEHINELPELMQLNLSTMEKLEREIEAKEELIKSLVNRKTYLEGQLATLEPTLSKVSPDGKRITTPEESLESLRSQYLSLSASLSEKHPDIINLKKQLAALESEVSRRKDLHQYRRRLAEKENQLSLMLEKYSEQHPDVVKLKREIKRLQDKTQGFSSAQSVLNFENEQVHNPAYINLEIQINTTQMEIQSVRRELESLKKKYENYRRRVENTPKVEKEYLDLERNHGNSKEQYQQIMDRLLAAKEARDLEEGRKGEKFTLLEPGVTPEKPYKPNRLAILLLGAVLAAGCGMGFGTVAEYMDHSVHRADELAEISGYTVLAVIPYLENSLGHTRKI